MRALPFRATLVLTLTAASASYAARHSSPPLAQVVDSLRADTSFSGVILVARNGAPILRHAFGDADAEWSVKNVPDSVFPIGSISKQFTALGILMLAQDGRLALSDPVTRYFPDAPPSWRSITIHELLTHTSGIPDLVRLPEFRELIRHHVALDSLVRLLETKPLDFEPGSRFLYGNSGYTLSAALIEKLTREPYAEFLEQRIFHPAGLRHTGVWDGARIVPRMARGYARHDGALELAEYLDWSVPTGAGTCYSTADDLLRYDRELHAGRLVPPAVVERMLSPNGYGYGYGWYISGSPGARLHEHMGDINGYGAYLAHDERSDVLVIVLTNLQRTPVQALARTLLRAARRDADATGR